MDITAIVHRYNKLNDYRNFMFRILADLPRYRRRKELAAGGLACRAPSRYLHGTATF